MATDTICVIIPVKNAATTIIEALESIETQTVVTNQTIVANGKKILVNVLLVFNNCTDGSEEIVNDWIIARSNATEVRYINIRIFNIFTEKINGSFVQALNLLYACASEYLDDRQQYMYCCRLDADDIMFSDRLEYCYNFMEEHPSIDYLAGGYVGFGAQNLCYAPIEKHVNRAHALQCMPVANPTLFMRCDTVFSMFESYFTINSNTNPLNFFREGYDRAEDYEHICRALDMGLSIYNVNRPLIYYRFGAHNTIEDRQQIASAEKIQVEYGTMWAVDDLVDGGGG